MLTQLGFPRRRRPAANSPRTHSRPALLPLSLSPSLFLTLSQQRTTMDNSHPVVPYIGQACAHPPTPLLPTHSLIPTSSSPRSAWAFVQPHFSQYGKDTLAKLIAFVEVRALSSPARIDSPRRVGFPTRDSARSPTRSRLLPTMRH